MSSTTIFIQAGTIMRACEPKIGDFFLQPDRVAKTFSGWRSVPKQTLRVIGVGKEISVNIDGKKAKINAPDWPRLVTATLEHGAKFFPCSA